MGDYSAEEFAKLKDDMALLKKTQGIEEPVDVKTSMGNLSQSINSLLKIFKQASEDMKTDSHDAVLVGQKMDKIIERLERIEMQNEKIAKGVVAVADMIEELQAGRLPRQVVTRPQPQVATQTSKPLPQYNMPEQRKRSVLDFKI